MPRKNSAVTAVTEPAKPTVKRAPRKESISTPSFSDKTFESRPEPIKRQPRRQSSPVMAIVIILLVVIAAGTYFASEYFKKQSADEAAAVNEIPAVEEPATSTPETPVDPTVSWVPYATPADSTSTVALAFKYPTELNITENADNIILSNPNVSSTQLNISWVKSKKDLKSYLVALDKFNEKSWEGQPSVKVTTSTDAVVISGQPAIFRQQKMLAADLDQYITYVKASDTVYAISLAAPQLDQNLLAFFVTFLNNLKISQ